MANNTEQVLAELKKYLVGEQLSSVIFVQDYLQVDFDGNCFTAYVFPTLNIGGKTFSFNQEGYRDALCSLIAKKVNDLDVVDDKYFKIIFDSAGDFLIFNLDPDSTPYEKLIFKDMDGGDYFWS